MTKEVLNHLLELIEKGNDKAKVKVANYYLYECNSDAKFKKARELYQSAIKDDVNRTDPDAYLGLAKIYHYGLGVKVNVKKALSYYELSGRRGNLESANIAAFANLFGIAGKPNYHLFRKMIVHLRNICFDSHESYLYDFAIGDCLFYGIGTKANLYSACNEYIIALKTLSKEIKREIFLHLNKSTEEKISEGIDWILEDSVNAIQHDLLRIDFDEKINRTPLETERNPKNFLIEESTYLDDLGLNDDVAANLKMAFCYANGFYVKKNLTKEKEYLIKAVSLGSNYAALKLALDINLDVDLNTRLALLGLTARRFIDRVSQTIEDLTPTDSTFKDIYLQDTYGAPQELFDDEEDEDFEEEYEEDTEFDVEPTEEEMKSYNEFDKFTQIFGLQDDDFLLDVLFEYYAVMYNR